MGSRIRTESAYNIYHVMQRGVGKQIIFEDYEDHSYYLKQLAELKQELGFELIAYCLMNNHTHLLLRINLDHLSTLMHRLGTSYACYYNNKYDRPGHLFQGRYLSEAIQDDKYLQTCVRYIHNNPVAAGISTRDKYQWSSYNEYIFGQDTRLCDTQLFLSIIGGIDEFVRFSKTIDDTEVMDTTDACPTYEDGMRLIKTECGISSNDASLEGTIVNRLSLKERNRIIRLLISKGFSVKSIERLTGVSKNIIYKVAKLYGK